MMLFGLNEVALITLAGVAILVYPRVVSLLARRFGAWRAEQQATDTPVETAAHVYDTVEPVVQVTGKQKEQVFLQRIGKLLQNH